MSIAPVYDKDGITIYHGDCLQIMPELPEHSVGMVLCDLPYGVTAYGWDSVISLEHLWEQYKRLLLHNKSIVLTSTQPFTTTLIASNREWFKYCWVWNKVTKTNAMNAKNRPLTQHEDICVFSAGTTANCSTRKMPYYPQGLTNATRSKTSNRRAPAYMSNKPRPSHKDYYVYQNATYPSSILTFSNADRTGVVHPSQKPVALMEYLIRTYTNKGELVLDNTMGSGTTLVAAKRTGRRAIGIELLEEYAEKAIKRLEAENLPLFEST